MIAKKKRGRSLQEYLQDLKREIGEERNLEKRTAP